MKEQASTIIKSVSGYTKSLPKKKKTLFLSVFVGIVLFAVILTLIINRKDYVVLYSGLNPDEASAIISEIESMNIDAHLSSDGTISVSKDQENQLRMTLATKGYPKSGFSYDIWTENVNMFTTDSQKRELVKMQLQERLQATIETLDGINEAIVTLDIPEQTNTVIATTNQKASASVVVHLNSGVTLNSQQIKGITYIVSKAISGLDEENVSITDGSGKLLGVDTSSGVDSIELEHQRLLFKQSFENQLCEEVKKLLSPSYGKNGLNVSVNAIINYDKQISDNTTYTPTDSDSNTGVIEHQDSSSATSTNGNSDGGVVGAETNADGTYPVEEDDENSNTTWSESSSSTSYLVNTLKKQTEKNGMQVDKVTVSLMVYKSDLSEADRAKLKSIVANATGTTTELVSVENLPLLENNEEPENNNITVTKEALSTTKLIIIGAAGLLFIILLSIFFIIISKKKSKNKRIAPNPYIPPEPVEIVKLTEPKPDSKEELIRKEIGNFSQSSPEIAAQLLKSWLHEEEK